jgi:hypothetical protein
MTPNQENDIDEILYLDDEDDEVEKEMRQKQIKPHGCLFPLHLY